MTGDARIVDENVDRPLSRHKAVEGLGDRARVPDVSDFGLGGDSVLRQSGDDVMNRRAAVDRRNLGALAAEIAAKSLADAAGRAGDRHDLSGESHAALSSAARPSPIQSRLVSRKWPQL